MKSIKIAFLGMFAALCILPASAEITFGTMAKKASTKTKGWIENFEKAKREAAENKQPILAWFTGSDWCGWCIRLDREVFSQKAFKSFADDNLILFMADFPRGKSQLPDVKKQNNQLSGQYGVQGFPTVILMDKKGKELARTGYKRGGADVYVDHLKGLMEDNGVGVSAKKKGGKGAGMSLYERMKAEKAQKAGK